MCFECVFFVFYNIFHIYFYALTIQLFCCDTTQKYLCSLLVLFFNLLYLLHLLWRLIGANWHL